MFPTWKWNEESSDISYRDFLPKNKQFLIIRKVPCDKRAEQCVEVEGPDVIMKVLIEIKSHFTFSQIAFVFLLLMLIAYFLVKMWANPSSK